MLFFLLVYLASKKIDWTPRRFHTIFQIFTFAVILNTASVLIEFYFFGELIRPKGFVDNPNHAGWQMVICCIYLFGLLFYQKSSILKSIFILSLIGYFSFGILATGSRAGIILYLSMPLILFLIKSRRNRVLFTLSSFFGIIFLIGFKSDSLSTFLKADTTKAAEERTALDRLKESDGSDPRKDLWKGGINAGIQSYLVGIGIGQFRIRGKEFIINPENGTVRGYLKKESGLGVHSDFIAIFAKTGIIGLLLYIIFLFGYFSQKIKLIFYKKNVNIINALGFTLLLSLIIYGIFSETFAIPTFWTTLILTNQKTISYD